MKEKEFFINNVTIIMSPQEKQGKNLHITDYLDKFHVKHNKLYQPYNLRQGDYSFQILGKDYRDEFLIERKYSLEEILSCVLEKNIMTKAKADLTDKELRNNLEYEFARMNDIGVKEKWLFLENSKSMDSIKVWKSKYSQTNRPSGEIIYSTLMSWSSGNRYNFKILCIQDRNEFAPNMLTLMYYYFRNDMKKRYGDNWLTIAKKIQKDLSSEETINNQQEKSDA